MAGTSHGKVNIVVSTGNAANNAQEIFKSWYDAMEHLVTFGYVQRIALQYGSGGTGTDFHDGANPFGDNAFFVYRWPPNVGRPWSWYMLVQYTGTASTYGNAPGNPALGNGAVPSTNSALGFSCAIGTDALGRDASPWNGTTNFDGADTKGAQVWDAAGDVFVFPRSNNTGGSHNTNKENTLGVAFSSATVNRRVHITSDLDNFNLIFMADDANNNGVWFYCGQYYPADDMSPVAPFCMFRAGNDPTTDEVYGDTAGTATNNGGAMASIQDGTTQASLSQVFGFKTVQPRMFAPVQGTYGDDSIVAGDPGRLAMPLWVRVDDGSNHGLVGWFDVEDYAQVGSKGPNDVRPSTGPPYTHVLVGTSSSPATKAMLKWGASEQPEVGSSRTGTNF